jgi:two-component system, cell cycle sensor histidine kinase and response regulator CckA
VLALLGYSVTAHTDSEAALAALRSSPDRFDLLIADYTMPRMTGLVLAREARRFLPGLPVIICSGHNEVNDERNAGPQGIDGFLAKPVDRNHLCELIRRVLSRPAGHAQPADRRAGALANPPL